MNMSASRPLALVRSLSDSGFEVTAQGSDLAHYNPCSLYGKAAVQMRARDRLKHSQIVLDASCSQAGDLSSADTRVSVMDHSLGVLDMVLDSISRELEPPLMDNSPKDYSEPPYDTLTEVKSVVQYGDLQEVDQTEVKERECADEVAQPPPKYNDISQDDMCHLINSMADVHKKLDILQGKMNNLLQEKKTDPDPQIIPSKGIDLAYSKEFGKKIFQRDSMYVQLEEVYINMQRINFLHRPKNSFIQKFQPFYGLNTIQKKTADASSQTILDCKSEISNLKDACLRLKEENIVLHKELKKLKESMKKNLPIPAPRQTKVKSTPLESEDCLAKTDQDPVYTIVNCVVGPPTTPVKDVRMTEVTYEWTISDYDRQFLDQRAGLADKTISAPFFITHKGYRARMEAFLDGDGDAKGSHLSVFFRILPSRMDDKLVWPLNLRITFILINQTDNPTKAIQSRRGIIEHSFPLPNKKGIYEQGESDCWGLLNLVSHVKIKMEQFIRKDKLLLQCQVQILPSLRQSKR